MFTLLVCRRGFDAAASIHLVSEDGRLAHSTLTVHRALRWLWQRGERQIVAMTDAGQELFLIEECGGLTLTLPALSMRRAFYGTCADLPEILGADAAPTVRAREITGQAETAIERRRARKRWVKRATSPAIIGAANNN